VRKTPSQICSEILKVRPSATTITAATLTVRDWIIRPGRNLARPEGNTGFTNFEFSVGGKWLQLLKQCAPTISRIAVVFDPANPSRTAYLRTIEAAAPSFGVQLTPAGVHDAAEIKQRVAIFAREPNGAVVEHPFGIRLACSLASCSRLELALAEERNGVTNYQHECEAKQDRSDALSVLRNIQAIIELFELPIVIKRGNRRPKPSADSCNGGGGETVSDQRTSQEVVAK